MATVSETQEGLHKALESWSSAQEELSKARPGRRGFYKRLQRASQTTEELRHAYGQWIGAKAAVRASNASRSRRAGSADPIPAVPVAGSADDGDSATLAEEV